MKLIPKENSLIDDVSIDRAAGRRWQAKRLDAWQLTQITLLVQEVITHF